MYGCRAGKFENTPLLNVLISFPLSSTLLSSCRSALGKSDSVIAVIVLFVRLSMVRLANPVSGGTFWERCAHRSVPLLVVALYLACVKKVHCAVRLYAWINGECKGDGNSDFDFKGTVVKELLFSSMYARLRLVLNVAGAIDEIWLLGAFDCTTAARHCNDRV